VSGYKDPSEIECGIYISVDWSRTPTQIFSLLFLRGVGGGGSMIRQKEKWRAHCIAVIKISRRPQLN